MKSIREAEVDLESYIREEEDFDVCYEYDVGDDSAGANSEHFQIQLSSPAWLQSRSETEGPVLGRHRIVAKRWDWPAIEAELRRLVDDCNADDWSSLISQLTTIRRAADMQR